jgi:hypothetical protein
MTMSISAILGTVIGLVFVFALAALFCSAVTESISNLLQKRARYLLTGLRAMLDEAPSTPITSQSQGAVRGGDDLHNLTRGLPPKGKNTATGSSTDPETPTGARDRIKQTMAGADNAKPGDLTARLFKHPLINSLQTRRVVPLPASMQGSFPGSNGGKRTLRNPQYIPPKLFAQALMDTLLPDTPGMQRSQSVLRQIEDAVDQLPETFPARASVKALLVQAGDDLSAFQRSLEDWYEAQMGRVTGWYKRWTKLILGVLGLALAIFVNVDTVRIGHTLYVDEPVRQAVVAQAAANPECSAETDPAERRRCVEDLAASLEESGLPLWYPDGCSFSSLSDCWKWADTDRPDAWMFVVKLIGWLLTAFAVSFGAPFWFDALSKLGSLRTSGPKPNADASADR